MPFGRDVDAARSIPITLYLRPDIMADARVLRALEGGRRQELIRKMLHLGFDSLVAAGEVADAPDPALPYVPPPTKPQVRRPPPPAAPPRTAAPPSLRAAPAAAPPPPPPDRATPSAQATSGRPRIGRIM